MGLTQEQKEIIKQTIKNSLLSRFKTYNPEPSYMPFHYRLLGKDRLALYSFIHSLNTNFGTSIFEPVAITLAKNNFNIAKRQVKLEGFISEAALFEIQKIIDDLVVANRKPDKLNEIELIRKVSQKGKMRKIKPTRVDLLLEDNKGKIYVIDIKTAKPNKGGFKEFKRTLLEWIAVILAENPKADIASLIAIPYNPYEPKPYSRWTMAGMIDLENELKVADEFWDFLAGDNAYDDLLDAFEQAGIELRPEIDKYFQKFK